MVEWVKYTAYGIPFGMPLADTNSDGLLNSTDVTAITNWTSGYDVRYDPNLDGVIDSSDITIATNAADITLGFGVLSDVGNRKGYAGYEHAPELANSMWHVRNRVMISELLGRWITRDPIGYAGGMNLYEYVQSTPMIAIDPFGLAPGDGGMGGGGGRRPVGEPVYPPSYYAGPLVPGCVGRRSVGDPIAPPGSGQGFAFTVGNTTTTSAGGSIAGIDNPQRFNKLEGYGSVIVRNPSGGGYYFPYLPAIIRRNLPNSSPWPQNGGNGSGSGNPGSVGNSGPCNLPAWALKRGGGAGCTFGSCWLNCMKKFTHWAVFAACGVALPITPFPKILVPGYQKGVGNPTPWTTWPSAREFRQKRPLRFGRRFGRRFTPTRNPFCAYLLGLAAGCAITCGVDPCSY